MLTRGLWIEHGKLNDSDRNPFVSLSGLEQVSNLFCLAHHSTTDEPKVTSTKVPFYLK